MQFCDYLLCVDGIRDFRLADAKAVVETGNASYSHSKFYYIVSSEVIEDRYLWIACEYDDAQSFRDHVVDKNTGYTSSNPRTKDQIEPRKQFFAMYDTQSKHLYLNDSLRKTFLRDYLQDTLQKEIKINNIYVNVDEFCARVKSIRGFRFTQVNNMLSVGGDLFKPIADLIGLDIPETLQLKVGYGDIPVHQAKGLLDRLFRQRDQFESVIAIGCDDDNVEQVFDFKHVLKHITIGVGKDENEHFNPDDIKIQLLAKLR